MLIGLDRHWRQRWRLVLIRVVQMVLFELGEDRRVATGFLAWRLQKAGFGLLRSLLPTIATRFRREVIFVGDILVVGAFRRHKARRARTLRGRFVQRKWLERWRQLADTGVRCV